MAKTLEDQDKLSREIFEGSYANDIWSGMHGHLAYDNQQRNTEKSEGRRRE